MALPAYQVIPSSCTIITRYDGVILPRSCCNDVSCVNSRLVYCVKFRNIMADNVLGAINWFLVKTLSDANVLGTSVILEEVQCRMSYE